MAGPAFNVGTGSISVVPDLGAAFARNLQRQLNAVPTPTIQVTPQLDPAALARIQQQINGIGGTANVNINTQQAQRSLGGLRTAFVGAFAALSARSLLQANNQMGGLSEKATLVTAKFTAMAGAATSVVGLVGGLGAGLAVAGAGIGAFAALAQPQLSAVKDATTAASDAQDAYNTAIATGDTAGAQKALEDRKAALATLTPAQRTATEATLRLKDAFKQQSNALAGVTLGVYTQGLNIATRLLPTLAPLAQAAGKALSGVFDRINTGFTSATAPGGGLYKFFDVVTATIGPVLNQLATIVTNLGVTFSETFQAFGPLIEPALAMISRLTDSLADGAGSDAFYDFVASLRPLLPPLEAAIKSIAGAFGAFVRAAVPLAGPVLGAVKAIGDALRNLFNSTQFSGFVQNIGSAITSLTPLFSALVGPIGNVLETLSAQFAALAPSLVPLITNFANAFSSVLVGLSPLLPIFVQLANVLVGFIPVLYPLITAFRDAMVPILHAVGEALIAIMPAVSQVIQAFTPLLPLFGQLLAAVVPVVAALIAGLAPVLAAIFQAMQPLLPIIIQFAQQLGGVLVQALGILLPALVPLIPPLGLLVQAFLQLFIAAIQPLLPVLPIFAQLLAAMVPVLIPLINAFTWFVNLIRPIAPLLLGLISPVFLIVGAVTLLTRFWLWAWNTVIFPIVRSAFPLFTWLYQNVVRPVFDAIKVAVGALGAAFSWVWNTILRPVFVAVWTVAQTMATILLAFVFAPIKLAWLALSAGFRFVWDTILHPVFGAVAAVASWVWNSVLRPVFGWIGRAWGALAGGFKWAWDNVLHPVLHAFSVVAGGVKDAFGAAVSGIKSIWNGLKRIFGEPLKVVIYPIVRNLAHAVDAVTDFAINKRPLNGLEHLKDPTYRDGGPVFGAGTRTSDSIRAWLSHREHVTNAFSADENRDVLTWMDQNPGERIPGFAGGGFVHSLTHNPLTDAVGSGVKAVAGGAKKVGGWVFDAGSWALDKGLGLLRIGAADAFDTAYHAFANPLLGLLGKTGVPQMLGSTVNTIERNVVDWIRGKEAAEDATLGGPAYGGSGDQWVHGTGLAGLNLEFFNRMHRMAQALHTPISVTSGYRDIAKQRVLYAKYLAGTGNLAAKPGTSNHEKGLAADIAPGRGTFGGRAGMFGLKFPISSEAWHIEPAGGGLGGARYSGGGPAGETLPGSPQAIARALLGRFGWGLNQYPPLNSLWTKESGWRVNAQNGSSGAYGIPQALPGSKMASAGGDWRTNPATQEKWGLGYIHDRYGSPAAAWAHSQRFNWYDNGGYLQPGLTLAMNATGRPEPVFTGSQFDDMVAGAAGGSSPLVHIENFNPTERTDVRLLASELAFERRRGRL